MLNEVPIVGFVPTKDMEAALPFYRDSLGLRLVADDGFAAVFEAAGTMLRLVRAESFTPQPFTILGWEVEDIVARVRALTERGVVFARYSFVEQDADGIWITPGGDRVAWFTDPDGNILSLSQHATP